MHQGHKLQFQLFWGGQKREALDGGYYDAIDPSTTNVFARLADAKSPDLNKAIESARQAFDQGPWANMGMALRGACLLKLAKLIRERAKELANLETMATGKTIKHSTFIDVPTCAETFEYYGELISHLNGETIQVSSPLLSQIEHEPVGVVGAIIPSNYPLIMTAWKLAPALLAGNCVVLKPAPEGCAAIMALAEMCGEAGFPQGVINILSSSDPTLGQVLVNHPSVDMISFTGSTETGRKVMALASGSVKKITLELGGKSPNIVFDDCDFDAALGGSLSAIFMNGGQMCTAGSRLFVHEKIYDAFVTELIKRAKSLTIGSAHDFNTEFGPLISSHQRDKVLKAINDAVLAGAHLACGGKIPQGLPQQGAYIEPTILTHVRNDMPIAQEEVFGPVLCVMSFSDLEEVVQMANDTPYGLAAMIWSKDLFKANALARRLRCGTVWINTYGAFINEAPFGGVKQSGFGRELGKQGLYEYTQIKHIATDQTPGGKSLVTSWF